ncbi:hypothetical protein V6N11_035288 [Hibiscus sabdariffa]|uniref:Uncharacterized protein n=1 Tax=Hibiscus sabdariffa TaxID=183260 RepID=A0ABR2R028_9ROSI
MGRVNVNGPGRVGRVESGGPIRVRVHQVRRANRFGPNTLGARLGIRILYYCIVDRVIGLGLVANGGGQEKAATDDNDAGKRRKIRGKSASQKKDKLLTERGRWRRSIEDKMRVSAKGEFQIYGRTVA